MQQFEYIAGGVVIALALAALAIYGGALGKIGSFLSDAFGVFLGMAAIALVFGVIAHLVLKRSRT